MSENPWRKHSLSSGGWRGEKYYTPHSYTPQVSSHGEWFVSGEWAFFRPTDTGFIVVAWNMSVYEITYIFDGEPYQYLSFGNIDAYIGFDVQKGIGFDAGASLVGWEYDFGDFQLGLDCVSIGFTSIFDEGIYDFGVGFGLFGFDISVDYEEILSQILGG